MEANKQEKKASSGLTVEQLGSQVDAFEGQLIQQKQAALLLNFDKENYQKTLDRKVRMNNKAMELTESNLRVLNKQIEEIKAKDKEPVEATESKPEPNPSPIAETQTAETHVAA